MMIRLAEAPVATAPPPIPRRWAAPRRGRDVAATEAAFLAGAALNELDRLVRTEPVWAGAWRQRLALKCAIAAARRMGLKADEAQLRDTWHWRPDGADPGPAGRLYSAWRIAAARPIPINERAFKTLADAFGAPRSAAFATLPARLAGLDRPAPFAAASILADAFAAQPEAEPLAWLIADCAVARAMGWPIAVPLLMGQLDTDVFRAKGGGRIPPGGEAFERALCLALTQAATEACRLAGEIARRAERLAAAAPKLRAKGAGEAIRRLLDDDAVSGSLTAPKLSRFATRRLFERLTALGAVRELSGRPTFRLYGL